MEYLDIIDENGNPTGQIVERFKAHREGILHRTAHVWLIRKYQGRVQLLLQKRSEEKDSNPGCYDTSSAGHIPAGVEYLPSAIRELQEELGITAVEEDFHYCGTRRIHYREIFHGQLFLDNQISKVYYIWRDVQPEELTLQKEEVSEARWMDYTDVVEMVSSHTPANCVHPEELEMLRVALNLG